MQYIGSYSADVSSVYVGVASFKHTEENVTSFTGTMF